MYRARRRVSRVGVRRRNGGLELRVDGTLASFYRPDRPETGSVWDALAAPLVMLSARSALRSRKVLRFLVLGLAGGSAARMARALHPDAEIVGVERDREVLRAARRWLDLDSVGVEVVTADALEFLEQDRRRYDAILEDVFIGNHRAIRKPDWLPEPGLALAARRLRAGGILASNTLDETSTMARTIGRLFPRVVSIEIAGFDNRVLVGGSERVGGLVLRSRLRREPLFGPVLPRLTIRTRPAPSER